jgi:hypothetical protein
MGLFNLLFPQNLAQGKDVTREPDTKIYYQDSYKMPLNLSLGEEKNTLIVEDMRWRNFLITVNVIAVGRQAPTLFR